MSVLALGAEHTRAASEILVLDLGSTSIKAARVDADGRVLSLGHAKAPPITGSGLQREFGPAKLMYRVFDALSAAKSGYTPRDKLALASQRSSFLLVAPQELGAPLSPVISWQDRRAVGWIAAHADAASWIGEITGLPLSAHYVGPKLAAWFAEDKKRADLARKKHVCLATLDTWIGFQLRALPDEAGVFVTDETMAARTLLFDPRVGEWSPRLCEFFGVPLAMLPRVLPSSGGRGELPRSYPIVASIADQSAGALHAVGAGTDGVLVNFGTGTFVLAPIGTSWERRQGYLTALLLSRETDSGERERLFALEGTINAGASLITSVEDVARIALEGLPADAHALPDANGIGAPHWRADLGPLQSSAMGRLSPSARARVLALGLCFRVREILEDLQTHDRRCVVAGGALHDEAFAQRLADALGREIEVCLEPEATLLGAAGLARGDDFTRGRAATRKVVPGRFREHLDARYAAWRRWVATVLAR